MATRLKALFPTKRTLGLNTDLYELAMAAAYFQADCVEDWATFELFTRKLPKSRGFLVAAGLEQALHYIQTVGFPEKILDYLRNREDFRNVNNAFFDYMRNFRFSGDVYALPEGTIFFGNEPVLQVHAPIIEAQILETYLINTINFQTMVASKAARICLAAKDKKVIDFGGRRAHSPQAALWAARAAFIGGCHATSNALANYEIGIPAKGTMAHSFVQFFRDEIEAFRQFQHTFREKSVLLVDTYNSLTGVEKALQMGEKIDGVRLDSGNVVELAIKTRELLDRHDAKEVQIIVSGDLDEEKIDSLAQRNPPIDAYGVGTNLVVSEDAPSCDMVYKLAEIVHNGVSRPCIKTSEGKATVPYRKQIFRRVHKGEFAGDLISKWDEKPAKNSYRPLLRKCIQKGKLVAKLPDVFRAKTCVREQLSRLPTAFKRLHNAEEYPVKYTEKLLESQKELKKQYA